jgi:DNA-binding transcriptional MocR family regulator
LGHALQIEGAEAGLHCTALLDQRWRDHVIVKQAAERGVFLRALSEFFDAAPPAAHNNGLVFGFACATPAQIRAAIRKLRPLFDT